MTNHDLTWRTLRLNHGLRWQKTRPTLAELKAAGDIWLRGLAVLMGLLFAYGIAGRMDYEDALIAELEAERTALRDANTTLANCLNGRPTGHWYEDSRGERTYIVCKGAEEIPVGKVKS